MQLASSLRAASLVLLAAGAAALTAPARAQLVTNGGFETYDALTVPSWTVSGNANQGAANDVFLFGNPHSGTFAAWLGTPTSDGFLSQTITTTPGTAYIVSYWLAVDTDSVSGLSSPNDFNATFGGQSLFSQTDLAATDGNADPANDYALYSFTTVATSASSVLQFGFRDDNSYLLLDDVSVASVPVPEASTTISFGLLLALGLGAAIFKKQRSRTAK